MSADYIPSDFGDLSGTVAASQLPASGVTPGTYPLATVTVDTHGRVTVASAGSISTADVSGLVADLAAKASDSAVVHLAGAETITGLKTFVAASSTTVGLVVQGVPSQSVNIQEWRNGNDQQLAAVDSIGRFYGAGAGSLTAPVFSFSGAGAADGVGWIAGNLLFFQGGILSLVLTDLLKSFRVPSDYTYSWASSSDNKTNQDTGFLRSSAGVIRLGVGATNNALILGSPTASTAALTVQGISGQTAPLVSLQGISSTSNVRVLGDLDAGFTVATDALYTGFVSLSAVDHNGKRLGVKVDSDGTNPVVTLYGPNTTVTGSLTVGGPSTIVTGLFAQGTSTFTGPVGFGGSVGFFSTPAVGQQTVTGSRSDGTALASLLSALAAFGLILDSTTA